MTPNTNHVWSIAFCSGGSIYIYDAKDHWVASVNGSHGGHRGFPSDAEALPNATLIAAAPELLEALKDLLLIFRTPGESYIEQSERIADLFFKETGYLAPGKSEPSGMWSEERDAQRLKAWEQWVAARTDRARQAITQAEEPQS